MKITYYGHSCFQLEMDGAKVLFDPFISPNGLAKYIDVHSVTPDYILQSHGHVDHIVDLVPIAKRSGALVLSSWEIKEWLEKKQGLEKLHPMNIGGSKKLDFGTVKMVFASHSNSLPDGTYGGTAAGFLIRSEGKTIYYAGDTALTQDMKLIGELQPPDLAFLPIGDNFTMDIDDAIIAAKFIRCTRIIGMHYDTFGYIVIDHEEAKRKFAEAGLELILMNIGETIAY